MKINAQPISKAEYIDTGILSLHSIFLTIQGEGPLVGTPSVFVRLAGCNLKCPFCDTDYTSGATKVSPQYIIDKAKELLPQESPLVVITGGEPFRQNLTPLVKDLLEAGFKVQIETNGTLYDGQFPYEDVTIVCSPKTGKINKHLAPHIDALKYVLHADEIELSDGLPTRALGHSASPVTARPPEGYTGEIYVQPIDVQDPLENSRHLDAAIRSSLTNGYRLCLQTHKIINME